MHHRRPLMHACLTRCPLCHRFCCTAHFSQRLARMTLYLTRQLRNLAGNTADRISDDTCAFRNPYLGASKRWQSGAAVAHGGDRKSTRLNSSHVAISYAVFCLKKKTNDIWSFQGSMDAQETDLDKIRLDCA